MKVNKSFIISVVFTLALGIGISALVFKPMGTVATEKNNAELYSEMKENAKEEVKSELQEQFKVQLEEEVKRIKGDTELQIKTLKAEYDSAIADAKLQQANDLQVAINKANESAQAAINQATSPEEIERRRQEDMKNNPEKYGLNEPIPQPVMPEEKPNLNDE